MKRRTLICASVLALGLSLVGVMIVVIRWRDLHALTGGTRTAEGATTPRGHSAPISSVAFSPDGTVVASGSFDHTVKLWDTLTGQLRMTCRGHGGPVLSLAFAPEGKVLASGGGDGMARIWDVPAGKELAAFPAMRVPRWSVRGGICSLVFAPDGKTLAGGLDNCTPDHTAYGDVMLWKADTGARIHAFQRLSCSSPVVGFTPDGNILALTDTRNIRLFDVTASKERTSLQPQESGIASSLAISGDGKLLAAVEISAGATDNEFTYRVQLWDLTTNRETGVLQRQTTRITSLAFAARAEALATGSEDGTVKLWNAAAGTELLSLQVNDDPVFSVAVTADGNTLASGGRDGAVRLWDVPKLLKQRADQQ